MEFPAKRFDLAISESSLQHVPAHNISCDYPAYFKRFGFSTLETGREVDLIGIYLVKMTRAVFLGKSRRIPNHNDNESYSI